MTTAKAYTGFTGEPVVCHCGSTRFFSCDSMGMMNAETGQPTRNLYQCEQCGELCTFTVNEPTS